MRKLSVRLEGESRGRDFKQAGLGQNWPGSPLNRHIFALIGLMGNYESSQRNSPFKSKLAPHVFLIEPA